MASRLGEGGGGESQTITTKAVRTARERRTVLNINDTSHSVDIEGRCMEHTMAQHHIRESTYDYMLPPATQPFCVSYIFILNVAKCLAILWGERKRNTPPESVRPHS